MRKKHVVVIQNDEFNEPRRLGEWLTEANLHLEVVPAYAGVPVPDTIRGYDGLIVLGGKGDPFDAPDGTPTYPWLPTTRALIAEAVETQLPYLGVCLGGQLAAVACGGVVGVCERGPDIGARRVLLNEDAKNDRLFSSLPENPVVIQWHKNEIQVLPEGAVHLASSPHVRNEAFRLGPAAWGLQWHFELDDVIARKKIEAATERLRDTGIDPASVLEEFLASLPELERTWRPFAHRFADIVRQGR